MDLETENRIAAILLREAAELRRQAEREGVHAYLRKPNVRGRPNSRFLTATVLGVQQANRAVEVNEMWKARRKEIEMQKKHRDRGHSSISETNRCRDGDNSRDRRIKDDSSVSTSYSKKMKGEERGLNDEDVEKLLHSKVKRGRGSVGPRMNETGPYLHCDSLGCEFETKIGGVVLGPTKPSFLKEDEVKKKRKKHSDEIMKRKKR